MDFLGDLFLVIGNDKISIDPFSISVKDADEINKRVTQARIKYSVFNKVPPREGESKDDWTKRYNEYIKEQDELQKGESIQAFIERTFEPVKYNDTRAFTLDVLTAIADVAKQGHKVNPESFDEVSTLELNDFIRRILKVAKVPANEFAE